MEKFSDRMIPKIFTIDHLKILFAKIDGEIQYVKKEKPRS